MIVAFKSHIYELEDLFHTVGDGVLNFKTLFVFATIVMILQTPLLRYLINVSNNGYKVPVTTGE